MAVNRKREEQGSKIGRWRKMRRPLRVAIKAIC